MSPKCIAEFNDLEKDLMSSPCRSLPIFMYDHENVGPFILTNDFSAKGMSAILSQVQGGQSDNYPGQNLSVRLLIKDIPPSRAIYVRSYTGPGNSNIF